MVIFYSIVERVRGSRSSRKQLSKVLQARALTRDQEDGERRRNRVARTDRDEKHAHHHHHVLDNEYHHSRDLFLGRQERSIARARDESADRRYSTPPSVLFVFVRVAPCAARRSCRSRQHRRRFLPLLTVLPQRVVDRVHQRSPTDPKRDRYDNGHAENSRRNGSHGVVGETGDVKDQADGGSDRHRPERRSAPGRLFHPRADSEHLRASPHQPRIDPIDDAPKKGATAAKKRTSGSLFFMHDDACVAGCRC